MNTDTGRCVSVLLGMAEMLRIQVLDACLVAPRPTSLVLETRCAPHVLVDPALQIKKRKPQAPTLVFVE